MFWWRWSTFPSLPSSPQGLVRLTACIMRGKGPDGLPVSFCAVCGYMSPSAQNAIRHERIHTGERPFQCHLCNRRFSQSSNYRRHLIAIHAANPPAPPTWGVDKKKEKELIRAICWAKNHINEFIGIFPLLLVKKSRKRVKIRKDFFVFDHLRGRNVFIFITFCGDVSASCLVVCRHQRQQGCHLPATFVLIRD